MSVETEAWKRLSIIQKWPFRASEFYKRMVGKKVDVIFLHEAN